MGASGVWSHLLAVQAARYRGNAYWDRRRMRAHIEIYVREFVQEWRWAQIDVEVAKV